MALTTTSISPTLNLVSTQIFVTDTTDYAAQGIPTDGSYTLSGTLRVDLLSSTGLSTVYNNIGLTPVDIDPNSSNTSQLPITLPTTTDGQIVVGTYIFYYQMIVDDGTNPAYTVTESFTYDYNDTVPVACLTHIINCQSSQILSTDETNYGTYYTDLDRTHTLYPPANSGLSNIVGTGPQLVAGPSITDKTWIQEVVTIVTSTYPDGLITVVRVVGSVEFAVVCDIGLSKVRCCLDNIRKRYFNLIRVNQVEASQLYTLTILPLQIAEQGYYDAVMTGNNDSASYWYSKIVEISGCSEDCGCSGTQPTLIDPAVGASQFTVVTNADSSIQVFTTVSGSTTTYSVQVNPSLQSLIASLYSRTITTTTPSYLQLTESGTGASRNTQIDFIGTNALGYGLTNKRLLIDTTTTGTSPSNYLELVTTTVVDAGGNIVTPDTAQIILLGQTIPNAASDVALISIGNIFVDPTLPYNVSAQVMSKYTSLISTSQSVLDVEVLFSDVVNGTINLRLINPTTGIAYTLAELVAAAFGEIYITLTINTQ